MTDDECNATTTIGGDPWRVAICCLPPGHAGPHWDQVQGWEW